jgi:predicted Zn-dependent protease
LAGDTWPSTKHLLEAEEEAKRCKSEMRLKFDKARSAFRDAPDDVDAMCRHAECLTRIGIDSETSAPARCMSLREASVLLARASAALPNNSSVIFASARVQMAMGDAANAQRLLGRALKLDPLSVGGAILASQVTAAANPASKQSAHDKLRRAAALHPTSAEARLRIARSLAERGDAKASLESLREAYGLAPGCSRAVGCLAAALSETARGLKDGGEAQRWVDRAR